jgi:hypothetical protein
MTSSRLVRTYLGLQADRDTVAGTLINHRIMSMSQAKLTRARVTDNQLGLARDASRDPRDGRTGLPDGVINVTVPVNVFEIGYWLSGFLTRGLPFGPGPYFHGFVSGGVPSNYLTLIQQFSSGAIEQANGCWVSQARIRWQKNATVARMDLTLIPALQLPTTSVLPPALASATVHPDVDLSEYRFAATWGGAAQAEVTALDLQIDLGLERIQGLNGNEWPTRHHAGDINISGSATLYGDAEAWRADAAFNLRKALLISGLCDSDPTQAISFTLPRVESDQFGRSVTESGPQSATVSLRASRGGVSPIPALSVAVTNQLASYV